MSYTALYRKYRPDTFDEVKGQDHVVTTLRNQVIADRIGHAYLFTGTRGTGKTSVAKIYARAVNCENPQNGNPCNVCAACRGILAGTSLNVIEIDAASNNGVDNIRQIREEVAYSPTEGRYKVYIIDEVHMLSTGAFNALLKTLEEPPSYVIFILATTEAHKIPVTILSRCQRYDFRRISQEEISLRLTDLLDREGVASEEKAVRYIARKADGGMRDALSLTDQCISFYLGETLTYERVLDVLGAVDTEVLGRLFRSVLRGDVSAVFLQLEELIYRGRDLTQLTADLTEYFRDLLLIRTAAAPEDLLDVSAENLALMREEAAMAEDETLLRAIRVFSRLSGDMRQAVNRRVLLEVALIRLCRPQMETDTTSLAERIRVVERILESGAWPAGSGQREIKKPAQSGAEESPQAAPQRTYEKAAPEEFQRVKQDWRQLAGAVEDPLFRKTLSTAQIKFDASGADSDTLYLISRDITAGHSASDTRQIQNLEDMIEDMIGKRLRVRILEKEEGGVSGKLRSVEVEKRIQENIDFPVETE